MEDCKGYGREVEKQKKPCRQQVVQSDPARTQVTGGPGDDMSPGPLFYHYFALGLGLIQVFLPDQYMYFSITYFFPIFSGAYGAVSRTTPGFEFSSRKSGPCSDTAISQP
jgi:hypothetical protein